MQYNEDANNYLSVCTYTHHSTPHITAADNPHISHTHIYRAYSMRRGAVGQEGAVGRHAASRYETDRSVFEPR